MSTYLVAVIIAWVVAQGGKVIVNFARSKGEVDYRLLYRSGDMPSSHSAVVVALATIIGLMNGTESAVFALAVVFAGIVMYDAVMVRRSSGEQGEAIRALITEQKSTIKLPRAAKGHAPFEVIIGAIIGCVVGLIIFFATKS